MKYDKISVITLDLEFNCECPNAFKWLIEYMRLTLPQRCGRTTSRAGGDRGELEGASATHLPGPWFNIKTSSHQCWKSHCGDKTILRPSYLHIGNSYSSNIASLYWFIPLFSFVGSQGHNGDFWWTESRNNNVFHDHVKMFLLYDRFEVISNNIKMGLYRAKYSNGYHYAMVMYWVAFSTYRARFIFILLKLLVQ